MKSPTDSLNGTVNGNANGNGNGARLNLREFPERTEVAQLLDTDAPTARTDEEAPAFTHKETAKSKATTQAPARKTRVGAVAGAAVLIGLALGSAYFGSNRIPALQSLLGEPPAAAPAAQLPAVVVGTPLVRNVQPQLQFLGQFSAIDSVELRPQVGGTLTSITFKDGDIVKQGTVLFTIDATPYSIKLSQAQAQVEAAQARLALANTELTRAKGLVQSGAFSAEEVERRSSEQLSAQASLDDAQAAVRDAQFDLDHTQITAPFTGKIGTHLVSVGNLVAGSRAATSPTTLLATIVSLDSIYLNFDMSESDYMTFLRERAEQTGPLADKVTIALTDEDAFTRGGTLDFIDNTLDRSSGTIHARATIPNKDLLLTPGGFGRIRVDLGSTKPAFLIPDASIFNDQSNHIVMTVDANNTVVPKVVELGDMQHGLRVIRSGLTAADRVIIDGAIMAKPGASVSPSTGTIQEKSDQVAVLNP